MAEDDEDQGSRHERGGGIHPELADDEGQDPLAHVRGSGMRSVADQYHLHAELLDEQRGVLNDLRAQVDHLEKASTHILEQASHLEETVRQSEERIKTGEAPIDTKPTKRFGGEKGPGW